MEPNRQKEQSTPMPTMARMKQKTQKARNPSPQETTFHFHLQAEAQASVPGQTLAHSRVEMRVPQAAQS